MRPCACPVPEAAMSPHRLRFTVTGIYRRSIWQVPGTAPGGKTVHTAGPCKLILPTHAAWTHGRPLLNPQGVGKIAGPATILRPNSQKTTPQMTLATLVKAG